jgi:hypothetical protein
LAARELLREVKPAYGANQNIQEGDLPKVTRESATTDAAYPSTSARPHFASSMRR